MWCVMETRNEKPRRGFCERSASVTASAKSSQRLRSLNAAAIANANAQIE